MSINCGSQCMICDFPIHFDTYKGCSHACKYCFVKAKYDIANIEPVDQTRSLRSFISGKRNFETKWCDWDIPLHWGGNSDPFQPCELTHQKSLDCLKIFAETKYPFIVSTKNPVMLTKEPYLSLIQQCNVVLQISMACSKYDKLEQGSPSYEERLKAAEFLSDKVQRIIARVRPYFPDCHKEIVNELPRYAKAGIHGISISSFVSLKKQKGMQRYGAKYLFPLEVITPKYEQIKQVCHDNGLKFYCSESDLDFMSDSLACCGTDGLKEFTGNKYNLSHLAYDDEKPEPTQAMQAKDTYQPFKCIGQSQAWAMRCKNKSFAELMIEIGGERIDVMKWAKEDYYKSRAVTE